MSNITNEAVLTFFLRVILGILFFFQGYDKVFNIGIAGVITFFKEESKHKTIPGFMLSTSAYLTSFIELICGGLLIVGLFSPYTYYLLGLDLILVSGAFSMLKPMWDMQILFPRLLLLAALLYLPQSWDTLSLDHWLFPIN